MVACYCVHLFFTTFYSHWGLLYGERVIGNHNLETQGGMEPIKIAIIDMVTANYLNKNNFPVLNILTGSRKEKQLPNVPFQQFECVVEVPCKDYGKGSFSTGLRKFPRGKTQPSPEMLRCPRASFLPAPLTSLFIACRVQLSLSLAAESHCARSSESYFSKSMVEKWEWHVFAQQEISMLPTSLSSSTQGYFFTYTTQKHLANILDFLYCLL